MESSIRDVDTLERENERLRERLNLTGSKEACGQGACGCCTVLLDDVAVPSCQILTADCDGRKVVTIEGLVDPVTGKLDPVQQQFIDDAAFQCGYCTPGIIMAVKGLLIKNPHPTREEIAEAFNLPVLARLPIDPKVAENYDNGKMEDVDTSKMEKVLEAVQKA